MRAAVWKLRSATMPGRYHVRTYDSKVMTVEQNPNTTHNSLTVKNALECNHSRECPWFSSDLIHFMDPWSFY